MDEEIKDMIKRVQKETYWGYGFSIFGIVYLITSLVMEIFTNEDFTIPFILGCTIFLVGYIWTIDARTIFNGRLLLKLNGKR